jgi:hypothetical protein
MVAEARHDRTMSVSALPASMIAAAVAILNVEPGGHRRLSATGPLPVSVF